MPAIGPFARPGLRTHPLLLRDVVLVRAGNSPRRFMQTLAATIASAGAAADHPVGHAPGRWQQTSRIPLNQPRVPTCVLTSLGSKD